MGAAGSVVLLGVAALSSTACSVVIGLDESYYITVDAGPSSSGSAAVGASGSGGSGATTGTGADGSGPVPGTCIDLGDFCIDATEVTAGQYARFLGQATEPQPDYCAWNLDYQPIDWPQTEPDHPVVQVDWCDAYAYCLWAGKRLCGSISGGAGTYSNTKNTSTAWYFACSHGGDQVMPYPESWDGSRCNGAEYPGTGLIDVGAATGCHGKGVYAGLYDLSGNAAEWEDACAGSAGMEDKCLRRGGSFQSKGQSGQACGDTSYSNRATMSDAIGFRCCSR